MTIPQAKPWRRYTGEEKSSSAEESALSHELGGEGLTRRSLLLTAGVAAAISLVGCEEEPEQIIPYGTPPPELTPGIPKRYATHMTVDGYAMGLIGTCHEGRPTKLDGNPDHPASLGGSTAMMQAWIYELYDRRRNRPLRRRQLPADRVQLKSELNDSQAAHGRGLHLLIGPNSSPTMARQLSLLTMTHPLLSIHVHASADPSAELAASQAVFNQELLAIHQLAQVSAGLCVDADPLASGPWSPRLAREWAGTRVTAGQLGPSSRWHAMESTPSCTGWSADHRLRIDARSVPLACARLLAYLGHAFPDRLPTTIRDRLAAVPGHDDTNSVRFIAACSDALTAAGPHAAIIGGERLDADTTTLLLAMREVLGCTDNTLRYQPCALLYGARDGMDELMRALRSGSVSTLMILGCDPMTTSGAADEFADLVRSVQTTICADVMPTATAAAMKWQIPIRHPLETWSDACAWDGTPSIGQPLISPLFAGWDIGDCLDLLSNTPDIAASLQARDAVLATWREAGLDDQKIHMALRRGAFAEPMRRPSTSSVRSFRWEAVSSAIHNLASPDPERIDCQIIRDLKVHDGRFAANPWLQELPDPISKLTWDNALMVSPVLAQQLGVATGDELALKTPEGRTLLAPVLIQPGQADRTVSIALGYGWCSTATGGGPSPITASSPAATPAGTSVCHLRTLQEPWLVSGIQLVRTGKRTLLAQTQEHWTLDERPIALESTVAQWQQQQVPEGARVEDEPSLRAGDGSWPDAGGNSQSTGGRQWGMVVDLALCTGCSACISACQAENNIPAVGKSSVLRSREMHWLRVDRYFQGSPSDPRSITQPMMCQQCEKAPCEYVCPTYATAHSSDGINEMTYNRCVGTRFCSNNCPYKVRRFNWYNFHAGDDQFEALLHNPGVTVRSRGVMEKCTYCVQRIRAAEIHARGEMRPIRDGEVITACQSACPTSAIVFGDIKDDDSAVAHARLDKRRFAVLEDSGAAPRTQYLARLRNSHPDLL